MKTIQALRDQVLIEKHGVNMYNDWDDFIDDATLTEILELNDKAWEAYAAQYKNQSQPEKEQEVNQLKMLCDARDRALDDAAVRIGEKNDHIKELEATLRKIEKLTVEIDTTEFIEIWTICKKALGEWKSESSPTEQPEETELQKNCLHANYIETTNKTFCAFCGKDMKPEQQNQPQPEKVDDVQWQDIMTTAAGIEPEKAQEEQSELWQSTYDFVDNLIVWQEKGKFYTWHESDTALLKELIEQGKKACNYETRKHHD